MPNTPEVNAMPGEEYGERPTKLRKLRAILIVQPIDVERKVHLTD